jgi:N-acetylmuramoyl-L-alanine amidase
VQFLTSAKEYKANDPLFKNIPNISMEKSGMAYKYAAGRFRTFAEVSDLLLKIKEIGYKDAFIVATRKDGTKITIQEAKELEKK